MITDERLDQMREAAMEETVFKRGDAGINTIRISFGERAIVLAMIYVGDSIRLALSPKEGM